MILIPGFKGSADTYNDVVAHYKNHYKCYVLTLAGFAGQPPSGLRDHLLLKQRDDIIRFITDKHLHKPVLVGFSFGAGLAMWVACTRPDLTGPFIDLDGTPFDAAVDDEQVNKDSVIKVEGARYQKALLQTPPGGKNAILFSIRPPTKKRALSMCRSWFRTPTGLRK